MTRRFHLCSLVILIGAAFAVLPCILHAQQINRRPINGATLGGLSAGTTVPLVVSPEAESYGEMLAAVRRGTPDLLERVLQNYAYTPRALNHYLNYYETPLIFHAISEAKLEHCKVLIRYGSIVDS